KTFFRQENSPPETIRPLSRTERRPGSPVRIPPKISPAPTGTVTSNSCGPLCSVLCPVRAGCPDARLESRSATESFSSLRRATFPSNCLTSYEKNCSGHSRDGETQSNRDIFSSLHNNKGGRRRRSAEPDASEAIG